MKKALIALLALSSPLMATTWYVNPTTGGTRYSANNNPTGQCNGQSPNSYVSGVNQPCPYSDPRMLWNEINSYNVAAWVIAGGDTVIFSGFEQSTGQTGQISGSTGNAGDFCYGIGPNCTAPPVPSGTSSQHTRLLGINCQTTPCYTTSTNPYIAPLGWYIPDPTKIEYLWGGGGAGGIPGWTLNLRGSQYVDIQGLDFTDHSSCIAFGVPAPPTCNNPSLETDVGIVLSSMTSNILMQDVRLHGFRARGLWGPIGGPITMTRMQINFNGFAGWDFDDQASPSTPDAPGSSITANYVVMTGNGCNEEYPVVDSYPAASCYDSGTGGFGDSWSGQNTELDSFTCNHCAQLYNTKDGFIGPHTQIANLLIENSVSIGNEGQQWKWGAVPNSTTTFVNNLTIGNCNRLSVPIPGMPSSAFVDLGVLCRAAGDVFSYYSAPNSSVLFANNTTIAYSNTVVDLSCEATGACGSTSYVFKNNIFLGYTQPLNAIPGGSGQAPGLFYFSDASDEVGLSSSYNVEYGVRNHGVQSVDDCATSGAAIVCADPLLVNEPAQGAIPPETPLDNFNFTLSSVSPAIGAGTSIPWLTTDYNGFPRPTPPSVGALEYGSVFTVAPPPSPPPPVTPPTSVTTATSVNVRVYPNPWRKDKHSGHPITFDQMAGGSDVKIFTASGHKVKELDGSSGSATWDLTNDSGNQVASGIYLYLIKDSQGNKSHGKLAIIQ